MNQNLLESVQLAFIYLWQEIWYKAEQAAFHTGVSGKARALKQILFSQLKQKFCGVKAAAVTACTVSGTL